MDCLCTNKAIPTAPWPLLIYTVASVFTKWWDFIPFKCIPQIQRYLKYCEAWRRKKCYDQAIFHLHRKIRFPPDRKDIRGFSLATVHAISKTMMHEVELTAKNRSGWKMSPMTIGCDPRDFPFYSETSCREIFLFFSLFALFYPLSSHHSSLPPSLSSLKPSPLTLIWIIRKI